MRILIASYLWQYLIFTRFLISYYSRFVVYLSFLVCISLMTDYVEHLFVYLFAIPIILLCEVSVKIFCPFYCVCFIMIAM